MGLTVVRIMTTAIMFWGIVDGFNKLVTKFPWNRKGEAEDQLRKLQEAGAVARPKHTFFLQPIKTQLRDMVGVVTCVVSAERKVGGVSEDKITGEQRRWLKTFVDITIVTKVMDRYELVDHLTAHRYRGELRVIRDGESMTADAFEAYAKCRWPDHYASIMLRLEP